MTVLGVMALAAGAGAVAFWTYLSREPPVRGRLVLASLRTATLVLLVLLLWNPGIPLGAGAGEVGAPEIVLDASLSMAARDSTGSTPWREAVNRARDAAGPEGRVLLYGSSPRVVSVDSLAEARPEDEGSRLAPALERIAALGGTSVRVLSDLRIEDPVAVSAVLEETGLDVRFEDVGVAVRNAGVAEAGAPASLDAGEEAAVDVLVASEGGGSGDSVTLELRADDRLLAARRVPVPEGNRQVRHRLEFVAPADAGVHRLEARATLAGDGFGADDRRTLRLEVEAEGAGLVLLSLRPDWEPRYLLTVLEQVSGLPARGFLRLSSQGWLPMGRGEERGGTVPDARVRELASRAEVLALHGVAGTSPDWTRELASGAGRLLLFPRDPAGAALADVSVTDWQEGEWYASPELPSSPLAGELAGVSLEGMPPLTALLPLAEELPGERAPLLARLGQQGPGRPVAVLAAGEERRAVVVLASGFWRWAARDGEPREAYRRLWSAATGWLLEGPIGEAVAGVTPVERPVPRGEPVEWRLRGPVGDTVSIRIEAGDSAVLDTTAAPAGTLVRTPALAPGRYSYTVRAPGLPETATGTLEVSGWSSELLRARIEPPGPATDVDADRAAGRPGRALRTHPAPYLLLLLLLSAEWIGRRRQGLR